MGMITVEGEVKEEMPTMEVIGADIIPQAGGSIGEGIIEAGMETIIGIGLLGGIIPRVTCKVRRNTVT